MGLGRDDVLNAKDQFISGDVVDGHGRAPFSRTLENECRFIVLDACYQVRGTIEKVVCLVDNSGSVLSRRALNAEVIAGLVRVSYSTLTLGIEKNMFDQSADDDRDFGSTSF